MSQHELHFQESIRAPLAQVFEFLADHDNFASMFGGSIRVVKAGHTEPHGVGSVRRIGPGPLSFDEEIVTFERPNRIEYKIVRGGPLKDHLGTILLKPSGEGTELDYTIRFKGKLPGLGTLTEQLLGFAWKRSARKALSKLER
jgi:carbon monoxide dehydrogenase subunit G